jgi:hypothetical protein
MPNLAHARRGVTSLPFFLAEQHMELKREAWRHNLRISIFTCTNISKLCCRIGTSLVSAIADRWFRISFQSTIVSFPQPFKRPPAYSFLSSTTLNINGRSIGEPQNCRLHWRVSLNYHRRDPLSLQSDGKLLNTARLHRLTVVLRYRTNIW